VHAMSSLSSLTLRELMVICDENGLDSSNCENKEQLVELLKSKGITSAPNTKVRVRKKERKKERKKDR
jgi:hypothetical protein